MSPDDPHSAPPPPRPGRIILPGAEPAAPAEAPHIVLPPGASVG